MSPHSIEPHKGMPSGFYGADTITYTINDSRFSPSDGWELTVFLSGLANLAVTGSISSADSGSWTITLPANKTKLLPEGIYEYQHRVERGAEAHTIDGGRTRVRASLQNAEIESRLTNAQRMLELVNKAIEYRLTGEGAIDEVNVAGQSVKHMDIVQLRQLRAQYQREIYSQLYNKGRNRNRKKNITIIFSRPE